MPLRAFDLLALDAPVIDKGEVPRWKLTFKQRASRSGPSTGCGKPAKHLALQNRRCAQKLGKLCLRGEVGPTQPSQEEAATLTRENNGSPAAIGGKSSADVVQMWCTAPLDAP